MNTHRVRPHTHTHTHTHTHAPAYESRAADPHPCMCVQVLSAVASELLKASLGPQPPVATLGIPTAAASPDTGNAEPPSTPPPSSNFVPPPPPRLPLASSASGAEDACRKASAAALFDVHASRDAEAAALDALEEPISLKDFGSSIGHEAARTPADLQGSWSAEQFVPHPRSATLERPSALMRSADTISQPQQTSAALCKRSRRFGWVWVRAWAWVWMCTCACVGVGMSWFVQGRIIHASQVIRVSESYCHLPYWESFPASHFTSWKALHLHKLTRLCWPGRLAVMDFRDPLKILQCTSLHWSAPSHWPRFNPYAL